jgi:hypothetical protein
MDEPGGRYAGGGERRTHEVCAGGQKVSALERQNRGRPLSGGERRPSQVHESVRLRALGGDFAELRRPRYAPRASNGCHDDGVKPRKPMAIHAASLRLASMVRTRSRHIDRARVAPAETQRVGRRDGGDQRVGGWAQAPAEGLDGHFAFGHSASASQSARLMRRWAASKKAVTLPPFAVRRRVRRRDLSRVAPPPQPHRDRGQQRGEHRRETQAHQVRGAGTSELGDGSGRGVRRRSVGGQFRDGAASGSRGFKER